MLRSSMPAASSKLLHRTETGAGLRPFQSADLPRITYICRNVYGGTDMLPYMIRTQLSNNPAATVLVAQPNPQQPVDGVVCAEVRASISFLFGLRVAEEARRNGLARTLMDAICNHSCSLSNVQHIMSTTIPQNAAPLRVFDALHFSHIATVDRWPQEHLQEAYEAAVGFVPNTQQPEQPVQFAAGQQSMLDHIPGVRAAIRAAAGHVGPQQWVCCKDVQQLQQAVASIRQQQQQQQQQHGSHGQQAPHGSLHHHQHPMDWLPWVYEVFPLQSSWVQERLAAGEVWLLPTPSQQPQKQQAQQQQQQSHTGGRHPQETPQPGPPAVAYEAVLVLSHTPLISRMCAGVLAATQTGVAAALEFVVEGLAVPHFVAYIDSGSRHSSGAVDPQLQLPPVLDLGRQGLGQRDYKCYLVFNRAAHKRGLPAVSDTSKL